MNYKKIILALSLKDDETTVIRAAVELARQLDAEVTLLHVNDTHAGEPSMMMDAPRKRREGDLREAVRKAGFAHEADEIRVDVVSGRDYSTKITEASSSADLLVIGHSHRNRFLEALSATLDEDVTNTARCPVLVVPKKG